MNFICEPCKQGADMEPARTPAADRRRRRQLHGRCEGGTRCDCQHGGRRG